MTLTDNLMNALQYRESLRERWSQEGTDSFRVFHGAVEGRPGLTVDAYGPLTLACVSAAHPLDALESGELTAFLEQVRPGPSAVATREGANLLPTWESSPEVWSSAYWSKELGLEFAVDLSKARRDPQLFLDFRAAKRAMKQWIQGAEVSAPPVSVLNLFAYTCSVSCQVADAGASEVWSVDFSESNLNWGRKNFRKNKHLDGPTEFLCEDCIGLLWTLTDNRKALSRKKAKPIKISPRQFSLVVVDPPAWSKGKYAAVDLRRDPETVFRPAWRCVEPRGAMLASNNSAKVTKAEFAQRLERMLEKEDPPHRCSRIDWLTPDLDFPSPDGEHPLKIAFCHKE